MSVRMFLGVYDAAGVIQSPGPVLSVSSFSYRAKLDGLGTTTIEVSAAEERAIDQLLVRRTVTVFVDPVDSNASVNFQFGPYLILKRAVRDTVNGPRLVLTCTDKAALLRDATTLFGRKYKSTILSTVIADLQTLVTGLGITLSVEAGYGSRAVSMRFDGATVWEALQSLANALGLHLSIFGSTVTIGGFGTLVYDNIFANIVGTGQNDLVTRPSPPLLIIDSFSKEDDVEEMCNWLLPIGAGTNQQALKLRDSTRVSPYTIQTATGPNGKSYWYLSDAASIATYGEVRRIVQWPDIVPASNTATDKVDAANQLYDAAAAYLGRMKSPTAQYTMSIRAAWGGGFSFPVMGFKYRVVYKGNVTNLQGVDVDYLDVDAFFWVVGFTFKINLEGSSLEVDINSTDVVPESTAGKIVSSIKENNTRGRTVSVIPNVSRWHYEQEISSALNTTARIEITDATLDVQRVLLRLRYGALRQALTTGVTDSASTPTGINITINGTNRTVALGGPWSGTGTQLLDITQYIVNDPGGLYQIHAIVFSCTGSNGRIQATFEVVETVTGVEVT